MYLNGPTHHKHRQPINIAMNTLQLQMDDICGLDNPQIKEKKTRKKNKKKLHIEYYILRY